MVTVADLIEYRRQHEKLVERVVSVRLPTAYGDLPGGRLRGGADRQAPRRARQGRRRRRRGRARPRPLRVPHRRRLPLAALRLRRAARLGAAPDRGRGARRRSSTSHRRAAASACSTSCAPTSCRSRASTPSRRTSGSASPPTRASTASARRSSPTSGSRRFACSRTIRRRSPASPASASPSSRRSRSRSSRTPRTASYLESKRDKMGHTIELHEQPSAGAVRSRQRLTGG